MDGDKNVNHLHILFFPKIVPLRKDLVAKLLGLRICKPSPLLVNDKLFSKIVVLFSHHHASEFLFCHILPVFNIVRLLKKVVNPIGKMVSPYGFMCTFQITSETENLAVYLTVMFLLL